MGLDMYLYAEKYVSGYRHEGNEAQNEFDKLLTSVGMDGLASSNSPHLTVRVCAAYWRKANAVHAWFVQNVQDGVDECEPHDVSREQLGELRKAAADALLAYQRGDKEAARTNLTPTDGFFFGNTEIDEWYAESLGRTIEQLDRVLAIEDPMVDFIYRSSW